MLENYPTVLTTEILEIKTRLFGSREPTLKRRTKASRCGSCVSSSTKLSAPWTTRFCDKAMYFYPGAAPWVLEGKDTVDDLPVEITTFPPSTAPYDDLFLSILHKHDASSKRRGEVALDDDGKRENLEGGCVGCGLQEASCEGSVLNQRDVVRCSILRRDDISSSGEQT
ncbi:hypothetical protein ARMSODRAFT_957103 [Armillaria solidipes]|uniref:Uncharacterized protein n=1 Tax=Armillaria solidipes TaxID=1076256 RepID=A0A2H3BY05_9AGAR|nr:hypothetical protein ARMSODRAFT_957103 [Armillaria solidipes]